MTYYAGHNLGAPSPRALVYARPQVVHERPMAAGARIDASVMLLNARTNGSCAGDDTGDIYSSVESLEDT